MRKTEPGGSATFPLRGSMQKEASMQESGDNKARSRKIKAVKRIAGVLLAAAVLCHPDLLYAAPHGGGGFHEGGFAAFHSGGFHAGGFYDGGLGGFHGGGFGGTFAGLHHRLGHPDGGYWDHGWHNGRSGW